MDQELSFDKNFTWWIYSVVILFQAQFYFIQDNLYQAILDKKFT